MKIVDRGSEIPQNATIVRVPLIEAMRLARIEREKKMQKERYNRNYHKGVNTDGS